MSGFLARADGSVDSKPHLSRLHWVGIIARRPKATIRHKSQPTAAERVSYRYRVCYLGLCEYLVSNPGDWSLTRTRPS
jgi:hypothetical protein